MSKRSDARLAKLLASELEKVGLNGTPMAAASSAAAVTAFPQLINLANPGMMQALARDPATFAGALGPGTPFLPAPLDQGTGPGGRPAPRKFQYDVADNLNITKKLAQWQTLAAAAVQCDLYARAISIRTSDVTKMDWKWNVSKNAIETIMEDNNCGSSEASTIARELNRAEIVRLSEFWENPYPQSDRSWNEWITESLWQVLVYDGWAVHPEFTLGGELLGLNPIDASTIKILLDNYGDFPRPPDPAYQQILWGFPRGEFIASTNSNVNNFLDGQYNITDRDQLSYFVMNRRTNTPYGFSPVEQSLAIANIYLEREAWMLAEYKFGTAASVYLKNNSVEITPENLAGWNRILNDYLQGSTANRQAHVTLPPGFDAEFAPQMVEKYKADYDEHLIKRVASFFGVAPSQFGVVAKAGLGGGKGAGEAEQDNDETVSSKPMNNYLENCINSLSRRYLGASRQVTFTLSDDEGAEDEVQISTSTKNYISSAVKTPNEVRGELGMTLSTAPEADQLAYVTATGPVFLSGLLAAQAVAQKQAANPPKPPAPIIQHIGAPGDNQEGVEPTDPGKQTGSTSEPEGGTQSKEPTEQEGSNQSGSKEAGLKLAEAKAFKTFISKGKTREFVFAHHTPEEAEELKAGLVPRPKESSFTTKRKAEDEASHDKITAVAKAHSGFIRTAITAGVSGVAAAIAHTERLAKETPEADIKSLASHAVSQNVTFNGSQAKEMLGNLYQDAGKLGTDAAAEATGSDAVVSRSVQDLLNQRGITLKGIDNSSMKRMSDAIAQGLANGDDHRTISDAVTAIIDDPARADVISITEANRSYNASFVDQLQAAGETQFDWVNDADPCPECEGELGLHPITDDAPPLHPNCRCVAVMADGSTESE